MLIGIVVSATSKKPDWLGVSIAGIAIAMTFLHVSKPDGVLETLSLKTRRGIYMKRGLNEQIEEASREGEEDILEDEVDKKKLRTWVYKKGIN